MACFYMLAPGYSCHGVLMGAELGAASGNGKTDEPRAWLGAYPGM